MIKIFISHSAKDSTVAEALIELLRAALSLPAKCIRCTSIDGYRLPGGADTIKHLKLEVNEAKVFIGLITIDSLQSPYVQFELGARWGGNGILVPLLAAKTTPSQLAGPLSGLNALSCDSESQVHQLIQDVATHLRISSGIAASYLGKVRKLLQASEDRIKYDAPLVMLFKAYITGESRFPSIGKVLAHYIIPVTILNEGERTLTPNYFELTVPIQGNSILFHPISIPHSSAFQSETNQAQFSNPQERDLLGNIGSLLPGQAKTGLLMFATEEVSLTVLESHATSAKKEMSVICTDIRGYRHNVLLIEEPNNVLGAAHQVGLIKKSAEPPSAS